MDLNKLKEIRRELHKIPELGFRETKTQKFLLNYIKTLQSDILTVQTWKTGIFVFLKGKEGTKTVGYRADIDGLPITEETGYSFSSEHVGHMHACGHDFHMTIALGTLTRLAQNQPDYNVLFIFQPAEEGPGGALPMMNSEKMKEWWPDTIFALHIAPEYPVGTVATRAGLLFANTSELFIDFKGKGGHAAYPHLTKDMVLASSQFVVQAQQIVSRQIDPLDSAVLTIGKMTGGFVQNVIAENARLEGTIRTLKPDTMTLIKEKIEALVKAIEVSFDCQGTIDYGSNYYQVHNNESYVDQFEKIINESRFDYVEANKAMTGEDFGYMLKEIPGFMFWLGVDSEFGLHNGRITPKEEALLVGVESAEKTIREIRVD